MLFGAKPASAHFAKPATVCSKSISMFQQSWPSMRFWMLSKRWISVSSMRPSGVVSPTTTRPDEAPMSIAA